MTDNQLDFPQSTAPERLLRLHDVLEATALSRSTVYREIKAGAFPAPVRIAETSRWSAQEIADYIEARKAARRSGNR